MSEDKEETSQKELSKMEYEPMNDVELKLVCNSIIIGLSLLFIFFS